MVTYCVKRENDHCNEIIECGLTFEQAPPEILLSKTAKLDNTSPMSDNKNTSEEAPND